MHKLILVSQSPRRRDILAAAGYNFCCDTVKVSEIINENLNIDDAIVDVARQKAEAYLLAHKELKSHKNLLLTADTVVVYEGRVLGKPKSFKEAHEFLTLLSSSTHEVKSSICIYDLAGGESFCDLATTKITFKKLSSIEINEYIKTGEPMDKAGAYGIQGGAAKFVVKQEGDYNNVVGFPLYLFEKIVRQNGWEIGKK